MLKYTCMATKAQLQEFLIIVISEKIVLLDLELLKKKCGLSSVAKSFTLQVKSSFRVNLTFLSTANRIVSIAAQI